MSTQLLTDLENQNGIRQALESGGVLSVDRGLPFLLVYRQPEEREDPGTSRLVTSEAAYLISRAGSNADRQLVRTIAEAGSRTYGAFVVLEIWSSPDPDSRAFTIRAPDGPAPETVDRLKTALDAMREIHEELTAVVETTDDRTPPGLPPLLTVEESWQGEILVLGLEVPPVYRDPEEGFVYPRFLRTFRRALSRAIRQALYEFLRVQATSNVRNYRALGTRSLPDTVWEVDRELSEIERSFDILLLTSPVNRKSARERFLRDGFDRNPNFHYRLLPADPDLLKRRLFALELESIDDPAIAELFDDKRQELETQFTMMKERGSPSFRYSSHRLFGTVDDELARIAEDLLANVHVPPRSTAETVDAEGFKRAAENELALYSTSSADLRNRVQLRRDIGGLMVSEGTLLVGDDLQLDPLRVDPLIHHEVGTHVLTYVNGQAQPFEQLSLGLAGYDELQEGLAVLSEYLVGGLDHLRMRLLAARVMAARSVEQGAEFVETFRLLTRDYGYSEGGAWSITTRVHASGGFTRDLIYLRGLIRLIELLRSGYDLKKLYVGKIAQKHIDIIEELRHRGVLHPPRLTPRFFESDEALERLARLRRGISLTDMIRSETP